MLLLLPICRWLLVLALDRQQFVGEDQHQAEESAQQGVRWFCNAAVVSIMCFWLLFASVPSVLLAG
jgi:hypothetical protein